MNIQQTSMILSTVKAAYPEFYRNMSKQDMEVMLNLWHVHFQDYDANIVIGAVHSFIAEDTKGFPPKIGAIKEYLHKLTTKPRLDEESAWNLVMKALRNGIYGAEEEFAKLPIEVQVSVGSAHQIREWSKMELDAINSVIAPVFKKGYRNRVAEQKNFEKLPAQAQQMISALTDAKRLEYENEN